MTVLEAMEGTEYIIKEIRTDDEELDGWIRMTLYYPDEATECQYIVKNGEIREDGCIDYTGPFLVKLEDVRKVYIRYKGSKKWLNLKFCAL